MSATETGVQIKDALTRHLDKLTELLTVTPPDVVRENREEWINLRDSAATLAELVQELLG